jgi:diguanylate cyclase (GGDEF)-like protein
MKKDPKKIKKVNVDSESESPLSEKSWTVLLADDEPVQRMLIGRMLSRAGYKVIFAEDGQQAIEHLITSDLSLVLTDWEMPNLDGIGLCQTIRSMSFPRYIYTIMLCSLDASEHVVMGLQAGFDDYLTKPIIEPELLARLNTGKRLIEMERSIRHATEENRRLAYIHPLTEVFNYRYLMSQLPIELDRAMTAKVPLSIVMCDIDNFKDVNDTHGHPVGSEVLVSVAAFLNRAAKAYHGWLSHHGGDEFAIVFPNIGVQAASTIAGSICAALSKEVIQLKNKKLKITASFGVSGWDGMVPEGSTADGLITMADSAVYHCKSNGRNQVVVRNVSFTQLA